MTDLKIRIFKNNGNEPSTTVTVPGKVLQVASRIIPKQLAIKLHENGIEIDEIIRLSQDPDVRGTIVEVEEHAKEERVVISLE